MKRIILSLTLLLAIAIGVNAQKTYALLVGVSTYQNSQMNLGNTTKDAKDLKKVLDLQRMKTTLITSRYANVANVRQKLNTIVNGATENDRIIFYFSGHGGPGIFCCYDDNFEYNELVNILSRAKAKEVYCFVDACHSGSAQNSANANYGWAQGRNMIFCMACRPEEYSWENNFIGHGYFTKAMIKGLRGKADTNADKTITMGELYKYIYADVTHRTHGDDGQHPQLIGPKSMYNGIMAKW